MATSDNYVSSAKFADIVDDCLWYTFEYLSFKEKFAVMRVCKRWRKVTSEMIKNEDSVKLVTAPITEISEIRSGNGDEVKRSWERIIGKQVEIFSNYKLEFVENVSIQSYYSHGHFCFSTQVLWLAQVSWLFDHLPRLKSLDFTDTQLFLPGNINFQASGRLGFLSSRLKSLRLQSFKDDLWLSTFFKEENVLEELCLKNGFYRNRDAVKLPLLKRIRLDAANLLNVAKLIANSPNLTDIRVKHLRMPNQGIKDNVTLYFARFIQLKTLKLGFVFGINHYQDGSVPLLTLSEARIEALRFPNLQHFKLSGVSVGPSMFEKILSKMPVIKSLKFRNVHVSCSCLNKPCHKCPKLFFEKIASLEQLKELHVNYKTDMGFDLVFVDTLTRFVNDGILPKLRKIRCTLGTFFSSALFLAFCNMAWEKPKEAFVMLAPFDDDDVIQNNPELLSIKPRNFEAVHSSCTSKTDVLPNARVRPQTARKSFNVQH